MAISNEKSRIIVVVDKEVKRSLLQLSKIDQRSLSNMCSKILTEYIKNKEKDGIK